VLRLRPRPAAGPRREKDRVRQLGFHSRVADGLVEPDYRQRCRADPLLDDNRHPDHGLGGMPLCRDIWLGVAGQLSIGSCRSARRWDRCRGRSRDRFNAAGSAHVVPRVGGFLVGNQFERGVIGLLVGLRRCRRRGFVRFLPLLMAAAAAHSAALGLGAGCHQRGGQCRRHNLSGHGIAALDWRSASRSAPSRAPSRRTLEPE
jgi:hypothetical protein